MRVDVEFEVGETAQGRWQVDSTCKPIRESLTRVLLFQVLGTHQAVSGAGGVVWDVRLAGYGSLRFIRKLLTHSLTKSACK